MESVTSYYNDEEVVKKYLAESNDGLMDYEFDLIESHFTTAGARILDLGCGTGRTTGPLSEMGFDVLGVDVSEAMVVAARERYPDLSFQVGDATELALEDERFDYVLFSFCGIDDIVPESARYEALREIHRVLIPGGLFAFASNNAVNRYLFDPADPEEWKTFIRFLIRNLRAGLIPSRYKLMSFSNAVGKAYAIPPWMQRRQLRQCGFVLDAMLRSKSRIRPIHFDPRPYYVARKIR